MKKVLIITYYWPPSGGSGVQRWLKFVKYLPSYGWEPHVFTPENPSFGVKDPSLEDDVPQEAEVIRFPIWEPYDIFFKVSGWFGARKVATPASLVPSNRKSVFQTISTWIRGNFFIPDPRRFWIKPSVKFLSDYVADNRIETIITTGPPHSMHLIGLRLKSRFPHLRWLADFRDPWTSWGLLDSLMVSKAARRLHRHMEYQVLTRADEIVTITPFYVKQFEQLGKRQVRLVTNGFDEDDFKDITLEKTEKFVIRHVGIVNEKCDPRPFMMALQQTIAEHPDFASDVRLEFIGEVHSDFKAYVEGAEALRKVTVFSGNIPHKKLIGMYGSSSLLLMILTGYKDAEGFLPGKLFEYLATGLPILAVGPTEGDAANLLNDTGAGIMLASEDYAGMRRALNESYVKWTTARRSAGASLKARRYSRKHITGQLVDILRLG